MKGFKIQGRSSARINRQAVEQRKGGKNRLIILQKMTMWRKKNFDLKKQVKGRPQRANKEA